MIIEECEGGSGRKLGVRMRARTLHVVHAHVPVPVEGV